MSLKGITFIHHKIANGGYIQDITAVKSSKDKVAALQSKDFKQPSF